MKRRGNAVWIESREREEGAREKENKCWMKRVKRIRKKKGEKKIKNKEKMHLYPGKIVTTGSSPFPPHHTFSYFSCLPSFFWVPPFQTAPPFSFSFGRFRRIHLAVLQSSLTRKLGGQVSRIITHTHTLEVNMLRVCKGVCTSSESYSFSLFFSSLFSFLLLLLLSEKEYPTFNWPLAAAQKTASGVLVFSSRR